jgi:uncharacterized protein
MRSKRLGTTDGERTFAVVFDVDDEVAAGLLEFAEAHELRGAHFTAIGALREVTLGYWRWETKQYQKIPLREQVEVLSLVGNVATGPDGTPAIHAHVVVGRDDGTAWGGHLLEGRVHPTLEVVIVESPKHLQRSIDPETGLALLAM